MSIDDKQESKEEAEAIEQEHEKDAEPDVADEGELDQDDLEGETEEESEEHESEEIEDREDEMVSDGK